MGFRSDLKFGQKYEEIAIEELNNEGYQLVEKAPNKYFPDYDFIMSKNDINIKYEVKADKQAIKYGNFAIETESSGKASGLALTTAEYYIYYLINEDNTHIKYIIPVVILKQMIVDELYHRLIKRVYGTSKKLYLFKLELIEQYKVKQCDDEPEKKKVKKAD